MAAAVTFVYADFIGMFPEFTSLTSGQANGYFLRAGSIFANAEYNPAFVIEPSPDSMAALLYLLTAHIAWLNAPRDASGNPASAGAPAAPLVGRISSAGQGSENVSVEWNGSGSPSEAWFLQTRYGAEFWQATAQFRTAAFYTNPTIVWGGVTPVVSTYRGR